MAPIQRRRGVKARVWAVETQTDNRGNRVEIAVEQPDEITVWIIPQRSSRAEVPGQLAINVVKIGVPGHYENLSLWTRVELLDSEWDVVSPPSYHHGTRHTRHWTLDLRERPSGGE